MFRSLEVQVRRRWQEGEAWIDSDELTTLIPDSLGPQASVMVARGAQAELWIGPILPFPRGREMPGNRAFISNECWRKPAKVSTPVFSVPFPVPRLSPVLIKAIYMLVRLALSTPPTFIPGKGVKPHVARGYPFPLVLLLFSP